MSSITQSQVPTFQLLLDYGVDDEVFDDAVKLFEDVKRRIGQTPNIKLVHAIVQQVQEILLDKVAEDVATSITEDFMKKLRELNY